MGTAAFLNTIGAKCLSTINTDNFMIIAYKSTAIVTVFTAAFAGPMARFAGHQVSAADIFGTDRTGMAMIRANNIFADIAFHREFLRNDMMAIVVKTCNDAIIA